MFKRLVRLAAACLLAFAGAASAQQVLGPRDDYHVAPYPGPRGYPSRRGGPSGYYLSPRVRPVSGTPMIRGAVSFIDYGRYRNYRDPAGTFLGRVRLSSIPRNRW